MKTLLKDETITHRQNIGFLQKRFFLVLVCFSVGANSYGVGIDPEKISRFGNGLKNIEKRMKRIGGHCKIINNGGTETVLDLPL